MGEIFATLGGVAALVAAGAFIGKLLLEKLADGALKRFEHSLAREGQAYKSYLGFSAAIDTDLRKRRADAYGELWRLTGLVSRWPRNADLTHEQLAEFSRSLRRWYFDIGGMYLSEPRAPLTATFRRRP